LAFLDDDDGHAPDQPERSQRYGAPRQRPYLARRLIALGVGVLILILLVLGFRACLESRKQRGFENYNSDLVAIAAESQQLSNGFFDRLEDPGDLTDLAFRAEVQADRSTAESLLDRVENADAPDEVAEAQGELEMAFELRRDGISLIADQISAALGNEDRQRAIEHIATAMRYFLASDVLYQRARVAIDTALDEEEVPVAEDERLPDSNFLPDPVESFISPTELTGILSSVAGKENVPPGVHGLALLDTSIGGTTLALDSLTTVSGGNTSELEVAAQNQGDTEETDIPVTYTLSGATDSFEGEGTIERIEAGDTETARLEIDGDPPTGEELALEVTVTPVLGEEIADNNTGNYTVIFE
jgi:hypothetical protein